MSAESDTLTLVALNGLVRVSLLQLPSVGDTKRVEIEHQWPNDMSTKAAEQELRKMVPNNKHLNHHTYRELLNSVGPQGYFRYFRNAPSTIKNFGYSLSETTKINGSTKRTHIRFSYPSIKRLQSTSSSVKFINYEGGMYDPLEFIGPLAARREVLVASTQPFELHDHLAPHILGWLSISNSTVSKLRRRVQKVLLNEPNENVLYELMQQLDEFSLRRGRKHVSVN